MNLNAYSFMSGDQGGRCVPMAPEPMLSIREVCEWLGIGETTLMKVRQRLLLVPVKIEGRVLYDPADVRKYLASLQA